MKICYIAPAVPGPEHAQRWIRYFAESGHEVHLILSSDEISYTGLEKVKLHILKRFGPRDRIINYLINSIPLLIQFGQLIDDIKPDVIHVHQISDLALLSAVRKTNPLIVTPWGSDVLVAPKQSKLSYYLARLVLSKADLITCDAYHIMKPLIDLGADSKKIKLICFGVDTRKFKPGKKDEKLKERLGVLDSPMIMSSRRLDADCDVESLITAVPMVLKEFPKAKFVIAGVGAHLASLKDMAGSLGVSECVKFVGWVPNNELPQYLTSADVFVSTALSDAGLAASTAEAMASGLPVIITDFGDNRKWVEDGVNGFIIPLSDPGKLAEKIIYLLKNERARMSFGANNRKIIEDRNDYYNEMGKMEKIYEKLIRR